MSKTSEKLKMRPAAEIIDGATDGQIRSWWKDVNTKGQWPTDMPIPQEAFESVWHRLQKRAIAAGDGKKK